MFKSLSFTALGKTQKLQDRGFGCDKAPAALGRKGLHSAPKETIIFLNK